MRTKLKFRRRSSSGGFGAIMVNVMPRRGAPDSRSEEGRDGAVGAAGRGPVGAPHAFVSGADPRPLNTNFDCSCTGCLSEALSDCIL